jgi:hypothetical protein
MVGLGWFRLGGGEDGAGLVEVAAFVGGNGVEAGGEGEAEALDERVGEADGGEVEVGVEAEKIQGGFVGVEKLERRVGKGGGRPRLDIFGGFASDLGRRLEGANEPGAEKSGERGAATKFFGFACGVGYTIHCVDVEAICDGEMIEALGDAPSSGMRAPSGLLLGQGGDERRGIVLHCDVSVVESLDFGVHAEISVGLVVLFRDFRV